MFSLLNSPNKLIKNMIQYSAIRSASIKGPRAFLRAQKHRSRMVRMRAIRLRVDAGCLSHTQTSETAMPMPMRSRHEIGVEGVAP